MVHGTSGMTKPGSDVGSSPWSATSGTSQPHTTTRALTTRMVTSGAGTTVVSRGHSTMIARPSATSAYTSQGTSRRCGSCAVNMRMPRALTNPVMTLRGIKRISLATPTAPITTCIIPAIQMVSSTYCRPCSCASGAMTTATEPAAAEIIAGRPPVSAMDIAMMTEANRPTFGSRPARMEKLRTSGIRAKDTASPPNTSLRKRAGEVKAARKDPAEASGINDLPYGNHRG